MKKKVTPGSYPLRLAGGLPVLFATLAACGGNVVFSAEGDGGSGGDDATPSVPSALFVEAEDGCDREAPVEEAVTWLTPADEGERTLLVELAFVDECTGAGGQHILVRTVDGAQELWMGGHACRFFDDALVDGTLRFGVARVSFTAALFQTPEGACVSFPGEMDPLQSSLQVRAIGVFASREGAERFAGAID